MAPRDIVRSVLHCALSLARPYAGANEIKLRDFIRRKIAGSCDAKGRIDTFGNLFFTVPMPDGTDARSIFTCHLDTVHQSDGDLCPVVDKHSWLIHAMPGHPLGADDGAGCAILAGMICQGIPGTYGFFRGEERGGKGAKYHAGAIPPGAYDRAVSFDRRGRGDICGSQLGQNLASETFVSALADALALGHSWADGIYTDSAEFGDSIPEIVNVSVGYENEHTPAETLDLAYFWKLFDAVLKVDFESLPVEGPTPKPDPWADYSHRLDRGPSPDDELDGIVRDFCAQSGLQGWEHDAMEFFLQAYDLGYGLGFDDGWTDGRSSVKKRGKHGRR